MGTKRVMKSNNNADEILLEDAFSDFIAEKESDNLSPSTIHSYQGSFKLFKNFVNELIGDDMFCSKIDRGTIMKWKTSMQNDALSNNGKPNSRSINHYLRDMRVFLNWCMHDNRAYISPRFPVEMIKGQEEPFKEFSVDEQKALIAKPQRKQDKHFAEWRTWAIVNFVLATGARASSLCNVKIENIDFAKREITLAHTKNKKAHVVPLSAGLDSALKEYMRVFDFTKAIYLFPSVGNEKLTVNALRLSFKRYCENRHVKKSNIHGLRHSYAKAFLKNSGGDSFRLKALLGHSTLEMTNRYVNLYIEDIKEDFDRFSPLDNLKSSSNRTNRIKKTD